MISSLNICIPTYNRAEYLIEMLKSIEYSVLNKYIPKVYIYISDNCSTDSTELKVNQFKEKSRLNITYLRQKKNFGPLVNLFTAFSMIKDKKGYFWLLGDDDKIMNNTVEFIFDEIENNNYDILLFNRMKCDEYLNPIKVDSYFKEENDILFNIKNESDYFKYLNQVKTLDGLMCFISSIIGSPKLYSFILKELETDYFYKQNLFPHTYFIHKFITNNFDTKIKYIYTPLVYWRGNNTSKEGDSDKIKSMVNYKEQIQIAEKIFTKKNILIKYITTLKKTYTFTKHMGYMNKATKKEFEYNRYILFLLRVNDITIFAYRAIGLLIATARYLKSSLKSNDK